MPLRICFILQVEGGFTFLVRFYWEAPVSGGSCWSPKWWKGVSQPVALSENVWCEGKGSEQTKQCVVCTCPGFLE